MLKTRMEFGLQINAASWMFWYFAILKIGFLSRIRLLHNLVYSVTEQTVKPRMMATTKICGMHWFFFVSWLLLLLLLFIGARHSFVYHRARNQARKCRLVYQSTSLTYKKSDLFVLYFFYGDLHGDIIFVSFLFSF